jgi:uncharacterized membrane protein
MQISIILSLLASLLTAAQTLFILLRGDGLCFNEGCRIVDNLTSVPPVVFNLVGFLFFQLVFWGLLLERKNPGWPLKTVRMLAVAGVASEGVLVGFQLSIAGAFCAYCLVICAFIVLLNISLGFKQTAAGAVAFAAVFLAFSGLQLNTAQGDKDLCLDRGNFGMRPADQSYPQFYLFFSSNCVHCENIIGLLKTIDSCSVHFQPIDDIRTLDFPGLERTPAYSTSANRSFLKSLGIEEVPILMVKDQDGIRILEGEQHIRVYLDRICETKTPSSNAPLQASSARDSLLQELAPKDDACSLLKDCTPLPASTQPRQ